MTTVLSIFNPSFLMFLGFIIIIALLVLYYENKMRDQNHKIASMLSLVSSLAEELNIVKIHLNHMNFTKGGGINSTIPPSEMSNQISMNISETNSLGEILISVSDDEADDTDDDDNDDDDDNNDDDDNDDDDNINNDENDIKILKFNNINFQDINELNDIDAEAFDDEDDNDNDNDNDEDNDDETDTYNNDIVSSDVDTNNEEFQETIQNINIDDIKNINLSFNLEGSKSVEVIDYKKLSLNQLRSIVLDKGLVTDSSKMKKQELLKLLHVEY